MRYLQRNRAAPAQLSTDTDHGGGGEIYANAPDRLLGQRGISEQAAQSARVFAIPAFSVSCSIRLSTWFCHDESGTPAAIVYEVAQYLRRSAIAYVLPVTAPNGPIRQECLKRNSTSRRSSQTTAPIALHPASGSRRACGTDEKGARRTGAHGGLCGQAAGTDGPQSPTGPLLRSSLDTDHQNRGR